MTDHGSAARLIGEDRDFQESYWSFQRIAWTTFAVLIAVALLGGMGAGGPLSQQTVRSGTALIEVPRVMRWASNDQIRIRQGVAPRESIEVVFSASFSEALQIQSITPAPFQSATTRNGTSYWFFLEPGAEADVIFHIKPLNPQLRFDGAISVGGAAPAPISFSILP